MEKCNNYNYCQFRQIHWAESHLGKVDLRDGEGDQGCADRIGLPVVEGGVDEEGLESDGSGNDERPEQFAEVVLR